MQSDGIQPTVIRAGNDNLFRSEIFSNTLTTLIGQQIEIYDTTGAIGAARACVLINDDYQQFASFTKDDHVLTYVPKKEKAAYGDAYEKWKKELNLILKY